MRREGSLMRNLRERGRENGRERNCLLLSWGAITETEHSLVLSPGVWLQEMSTPRTPHLGRGYRDRRAAGAQVHDVHNHGHGTLGAAAAA